MNLRFTKWWPGYFDKSERTAIVSGVVVLASTHDAELRVLHLPVCKGLCLFGVDVS